jgi:hypothetical protein
MVVMFHLFLRISEQAAEPKRKLRDGSTAALPSAASVVSRESGDHQGNRRTVVFALAELTTDD